MLARLHPPLRWLPHKVHLLRVPLPLALLPYLDRNPKGVGVWFSRHRLLATTLFTLFVVPCAYTHMARHEHHTPTPTGELEPEVETGSRRG